MIAHEIHTNKPLLSKTEQDVSPDSPDDVVDATVDEAHSRSVDDVGSSLVKLRKYLHIGEEGYPRFVILSGAYAHMNSLSIRITIIGFSLCLGIGIS